MKKTVTLSSLLTGHASKKKVDSSDTWDSMPAASKPDIQEQDPSFCGEDTLESIEMTSELTSSPLKSSQPTPKGKSQQSVQSFLMNSRLKKSNSIAPKDLTVEPEIIALDDDFNDGLNMGNGRGNHCSGTSVNRVATPSDFKKTTLKDLFNNFKQPESKQLKMNASVVSNATVERETEDFRLHRKVREKAVNSQTPFPYVQLVEPRDENLHDRKLTLPLKKKAKSPPISPVSVFDPNEFHKLNASNRLNSGPDRVKMAQGTKKYSSLWPQLLKPRTLNEVMLEPSLKKNVSDWISVAFSKLKRTTTRNKLLRRQQTENETLDDFIVDECMDGDNYSKEEFVPLMILFGEGIGKNALIEVLMEDLEGQIYEVNTSNNRSKKDILDTLTEFSTTHCVKGQGSKGIILFDDVDVLFKEHDKFFWQAVERILSSSRRPIILTCRDINFLPTSIVQLAIDEKSLFHTKRVSHQTVTAFLEMYCQKLGLKMDRSILQLLVTCSKRDIRKCLMDLQFCCTPPAEFIVPDSTSKEDIECVDLKQMLTNADLLSCSDVIESKTHWKSSIIQDIDQTLMSPVVQEAQSNMSDDQERLKHDYLIDYRLHLIDSINYPLLPFELSIGCFLEQKLSTLVPHKLTKPKICFNFEKMKRASVDYLKTRVGKKNSIEWQARKTRNSRKIREILSHFDGSYRTDSWDESVIFDFDMNNPKDVKEQINPYVLEIAKNELDVKESNKRIFLEQCEGIDKDHHDEVAWRLTHERLLKPIWFKADPRVVIDSWK